MATQVIVLNADITNQWFIHDTSPIYTALNDVSDSTSIQGSQLNGDSAGEIEEFGTNEHIGTAWTISNVQIITRGRATGSATCLIAISFDGGASWGDWGIPQNVSFTTSITNRTNNFSGLSQTNQGGIDFRIKYQIGIMPPKSLIHIVKTTITWTYTVDSVGYGHDYMGVPAASIGSVNGVPTANIASIKGVP